MYSLINNENEEEENNIFGAKFLGNQFCTADIYVSKKKKSKTYSNLIFDVRVEK